MREIFGQIYGLFDPRDERLRYVGQTTKALRARLACYLVPSSLKEHRHVVRWVKGLVDQGLQPDIRRLDVAFDREELDRLERGWIARCRAFGYALTNHSAGGRGNAGHVVSAETRAKISRAQKGKPRPKHSASTRQKMSAAHKGRCYHNPEHYQRLADLKRGVPRSRETRAKISATKQANPSRHRAGTTHTDAAKEQVSKNRRGKYMGKVHHNFRADISTGFILQRLAEGATKVAIAEELGVSPTFIHRRIARHRRAG